jgi:hypothetical protein
MIAAGVTTADITITVIDDSEVELTPETVIVELGTPTGATLGTTTSQTVTITDNDLPSVTLGAPSAATIAEGDSPNTVTITVNLSAASSSAVTVPFTVSGTATDGSDYTITTSPITFAAGVTTADITITVIDDSEVELTPETVIVDLGAPTGATLGTTTSQTVTIIDDDAEDTRIIVPSLVARPHLIPGDGLKTAILFRANTNTTLTVGQVGVASLTEEVMLLDEDLNSVGGQSSGLFTANLLAGNSYALIFMGRSTDSIFLVRSSAGFESLSGSTTNLLRASDVNADGESTVLDALLIVNQLSRQSSGEGEDVGALVQTGRYYDVNNDGKVTAGDALRVLNELARQNTAGEGEQLAASVAQEKSWVVSAGTADEGLGVGIVTAPTGEGPLMAAASMGQAWVNQPVLVVDFDAAEDASRSVDESLSDESFLDQLALS